MKRNWEAIIEKAGRWYVFIFMTTYGAAKLFGGQFYTPERIPEEVADTAIGQATDFDLAWAFMGRSFGYMLFLGVSEIIGAVLLLFERTKLLGVLVLIPILVNVIVFDVFFLDAYGALGSAVIYLSLLFVILFINRQRLVPVVDQLTERKQESGLSTGERWKTLGLVLLIMALVFAFDQTVVNVLGHGKG